MNPAFTRCRMPRPSIDVGLIQDHTLSSRLHRCLITSRRTLGLYALNTLHVDLHKPAQITATAANASSGLQLPRRISNQRLLLVAGESI